MPRPYTGADVDTPANAILQFPECAAQIGAICVEWSRIEETLAYYFSFLLFGIRQAGDDGEVYAMEAFDSVLTLSQKKTILLNAAGRRLGEKLRGELNEVLKRVQKAATSRNDIAHGRWGISADNKRELVWAKRTGVPNSELRVYELADFERILEKLNQAYLDILRFFQSQEVVRLLKAAAGIVVRNILAVHQGEAGQ